MSGPPLSRFTKGMLEEYVFPGTDAAVVFVADGSPPSPEVKEVLGRSSHQRWHPVAGGHNVKIPFHYAEDHAALFAREAKGWDHEHCDFCGDSIGIGELCWTAPSEGGVWIFCAKCRQKVPAKHPWWRFWS